MDGGDGSILIYSEHFVSGAKVWILPKLSLDHLSVFHPAGQAVVALE